MLEEAPVAARRPPVAAPHWLQKRSPGVSAAPQPEQAVSSRGVPQEAQNRPLASVPQDGHFMRGR